MSSYRLIAVISCAFLCASCGKGAESTGSQNRSDLVVVGSSGFLQSSASAAEIASANATYRLIDGGSNQAIGTLEISNGWAIEHSDKYPSVQETTSLSAFSSPFADCRGATEQKKDFDGVYNESRALCRSLRSFDVKAKGYSGGRYDFKGAADDLFFFSQAKGHLPTIYRLKHIR